MAHRNKVLQSIETPDGGRCVDLFVAPDGRFGFAEFRRDPEDSYGWRPGDIPAVEGFASEAEALSEARRHVAWLAMVLDGQD